MLRTLLLVTLLSISPNLFSSSLPPMSFTDQWDHAQVLSEKTRIVIFSHHKDGGEWVRKTLEKLALKDLGSLNWLYVADISGMPKLVTKMFALPKMRDYDFPIALVRDESSITSWPKEDNTISIFQLDNLSITRTQTANSAQQLEQILQSLAGES